MRKKKRHKKIKQRLHKSRFTWFLIITLIIGAISVWVANKDKSMSSIVSSYQSIEQEEAGGHDGYEEPAEGEYKEVIIRIKDGKFVPEKLEVAPDTLIIFENEEEHVPHIVVSDTTGKEDEITYDTGELPYEEKVPTVEYGLPGTYTYHDKLNPQLRGIIVVKE